MSQVNLSYNSDAEAALLGNLLQYPESIQDCLDMNLQVIDFFDEKHQLIYKTIVAMDAENEKCDIVTLSNRLNLNKSLDKIGGREYLLYLIDQSISKSYTKQYIKIIRSSSTMRQFVKATEELKTDGQSGSASVDELITKAQTTFEYLANERPVESIKDGKVVFDETHAKIKELKIAGNKITGVKSKFSDLDKITAGFQNGDFIIIAARPSVGKTALGINFAINAASYAPGAVAFFSLEMSAQQLAMRMISVDSGIPLQKMRTGLLNDVDSSSINESIIRLKSRPIFIDESSALKVRDIYAKCRNLKKSKNGLSIVFVDYIGLIAGDGNSENRQQEVSKISRELKAMARNLNVPVVALSQLRRGEQGKKDKIPRLQDLRESGSLEQDADLVLLIHRPNYIDSIDEDKKGGIPKREYTGTQEIEDINLIVAKHRNGPSGMTIDLKFDPNVTKFISVEKGRNNG